MKKNVLFLFATVVIWICCGFGQSYESHQFTKEEAITVIKESYLFMWFRYPKDTVANINRLVDNINKVVPVSNEKRGEVIASILFEIRQTEKILSVNDVLDSRGWQQRVNLPNFIPIMGINANDIIKSSFSSSDYEKIYDRLVNDRIHARNAYGYLFQLYNEGKSPEAKIIVNGANPRGALDVVFEHFNI